MNLNIKLDDEEEQAVPYVNRFAINIPSAAPALSLNIVNSGLSGQSYIINPVTSVGQNIVTYQPVQSYIALPAENEGNLIHGLPVGMPVPVGLPVPAGLLPNHNFMNTSIIIRNEEPSNVIKSQNHANSDGEIKLSYMEKPVEEISNHNVDDNIDIQNMGLNCSAQNDAQRELETVTKKPCPLEMSIKAANIDLEFEKCKGDGQLESELVGNCQLGLEKQPIIVESISLGEELEGGILKVPLEIPSVQINNNIVKPTKTEITWENNNVKGNGVDNGFQETLICEVEEVNDDDDDVDEDDDEEEDDDDDDEDDDEDDVEEDEEEEKEVGEKKGSTSSEESDCLPLSVALNLNKKLKSKGERRRKQKADVDPKERSLEEERGGKKKRSQKSRKQDKEEGRSGSSSESEEGLNLKRIKNEFNYKCYYEPKTIKSGASLVLKAEDKTKKFIRVRNCCAKRDCGNKISVQDQKTAHRNFYELESNVKRDGYLVNCIEHVPRSKSWGSGGKGNPGEKQEEKKLMENANIQLDIENESNGNQKVSDEIQKAISESLKDCIANEERRRKEEPEEEEEEEVGEEKNSWNFYIVIDRCRKKVCLQFLLKLFRITKSRIKQLQKKILLGTPINEEASKPKSEIWDLAKSHLYSLAGEECAHCDSIPRHRFLTESPTREDLFSYFKLFYLSELGTEPNIKYNSYKRFLEKKTSVVFAPYKKGACAGCEEMRKRKPRKGEKKTTKGKSEAENRKRWVIKSDSEKHSSDDEPLLKRKRLKLTIPLKCVEGKSQDNGRKRNGRGSGVEKKTKGRSNRERTKHTSSRGRDVWSLMLLHLGTMPYKEPSACVSKKKHRFFDSSFTTQKLFEDYRKYFLKETNSELGLGFTMYEKYFNRNCNYTIADLDVNAPNCPSCAAAPRS